MYKLKITYPSIADFQGNFIGALIFYSHGASNSCIINDKITCFKIDDHYSIRRLKHPKISQNLLKQIAKHVCGFQHFLITSARDGIYHIKEKK